MTPALAFTLIHGLITLPLLLLAIGLWSVFT